MLCIREGRVRVRGVLGLSQNTWVCLAFWLSIVEVLREKI